MGSSTAAAAAAGPASGYRADIDGLRAVAVLAVMAFHAYPARLPGGFAGVDVFFVISGYLITRDIVQRLAANRFGLVDFYRRRVLRLFPALAVLLPVTAALGWIALLPDEFHHLLTQLAASSAFVQNIAVLQDSGYFDNASALNPLLHLWSLSVEEQFYLVCPLLLMLAGTLGRQRRLMVVLAAASFSAALYGTATWPDAAYYLAPTRAWELLAGAGLALWARHPVSAGAREAMATAGLAAVVLAFVALDRHAGFPGAWALLPTIGAALLIAGHEATRVARWLGAAPMRYLGRISYPLYLWHWVLLAYLRVVDGMNAATAPKTAMLALSVLLAVATYHGVELPLRRRRDDRRVAVLLVAVLGTIGLLCLAVLASGMRVPQPIVHDARSDALMQDLRLQERAGGAAPCGAEIAAAVGAVTHCQQAAGHHPTAAVIGDSHAFHLFAGLVGTDHRRHWLLASKTSCPPVMGVQVVVDGIDCGAFAERVVARLAADTSVRTVLVAFAGVYLRPAPSAAAGWRFFDRERIVFRDRSVPGPGQASDLLQQGIGRTVAALQAAGKQVVVFTDIPELPFEPQDCIARPIVGLRRADCSIARTAADAARRPMQRVVDVLLQQQPGALRYDPIDTLCDGRQCAALRGDMLLYRDSHHLSPRGSLIVARPFVSWLDAQSPASDPSRPVAR